MPCSAVAFSSFLAYKYPKKGKCLIAQMSSQNTCLLLRYVECELPTFHFRLGENFENLKIKKVHNTYFIKPLLIFKRVLFQKF